MLLWCLDVDQTCHFQAGVPGGQGCVGVPGSEAVWGGTGHFQAGVPVGPTVGTAAGARGGQGRGGVRGVAHQPVEVAEELTVVLGGGRGGSVSEMRDGSKPGGGGSGVPSAGASRGPPTSQGEKSAPRKRRRRRRRMARQQRAGPEGTLGGRRAVMGGVGGTAASGRYITWRAGFRQPRRVAC